MIRYSLRHLEYLVAAADHGSVAKAARAINVSQSAVSIAISHLEGLYGRRMFLRDHARGMILTPAGQEVLVRARRLLREAEELFSAAAAADEVVGEVRLGCYDSLGPVYLGALARRLHERHPGIRLTPWLADIPSLRAALPQRRIDLVLAFDVGFVAARELLSLGQMTPHALLPADHRLAARARVSLAELAAEPFILVDEPGSREQVLAVLGRHGLRPVVRAWTTSFELQRSLVANGQGIAVNYVLPSAPLSYDGRPLVTVAIAEALEPLPVKLFGPADGVLPAPAVKLVEAASSLWIVEDPLLPEARAAAQAAIDPAAHER